MKLDLPILAVGGIAVYESLLLVSGTKPLFQPDPIYNFLIGLFTGPCREFSCDVGKIPRGKPYCDCVPNTCDCDQGWFVLLDGSVKCVDMGRPSLICGSNQLKRGPPHCDCITIERWERPYNMCDTSAPEYTQQQLIDYGIDVADYQIVQVNNPSCTSCGCPSKIISVGIDVGDVLGQDVLKTLGFV